MNTRIRTSFLFFILFLAFGMTMTSCYKKTKGTENSNNERPQQQNTEEIEKTDLDTKISEQVLTQFAESNLKIVAIAQKAQEGKISKRTRITLEEVEKNHSQLKNKIRKIAKDNFIIIPNTLYDTTIIKNFIDEMTITLYLKKLENSLLTELDFYKKTETTTHNKDLKALIKEGIPVINKNISLIKEEQKLH
jgi:hypothetical protein